ncbi:MAG: TonB-dependent receptor [Deltaproteobacteria bacterium]|nr:TonB-dependent receptor [Deltaproteobacteria bacterium]
MAINIVKIFCTALSVFIILTPSGFAQHHQSEKDVYTLDEVEVTSRKLSEYVKNNPQNIIEMNKEEISERNFLEVGEAISSMPGVDVSQSSGSSGARISIRGGGGSGTVLVMIDGKPLNSAQYGGVNLGSIPVEIIERITLFKPPVPVWLGPGGAGGVINITTLNAGKRLLKKEKNIARLKLNGGSYGAAELNASYMINMEKSKVLLAASASHMDGKRPNSDDDSQNASIKYQHEGSSGKRYDLNGSYYHSSHGSSGPLDNPTPDARQRYQKASLDLQANGFLNSKKELSLKTYIDLENLKDKSQMGFESTLDVLKSGLNLETVWDSSEKRLSKRLGVLFETNRVDHNLSGDHHREKASMHLQQDREFDFVNATLGLRGDYTNDFGVFPAVSTGISFPINTDTIIKTTAGYSVNIPTFNQLYQPSHGSIDLVRGNPDLDEEKVYAFDLSLTHNFDKNTVLNTSIFRTETKNLITHIRGDDLIYRPINISSAYKQGVEVAFKLPVTQMIAMDMSYIYQETENEETGYDLPYSPDHTFKVTGIITLPSKTKVEATVKGNSRQYSSPGTLQEQVLASYAAMNIKIIHPVTILNYGGEVYLHMDNLLDTAFETHAGYPDDGFRFIAGLNINF